jgi:Flp pilus assembly protein TadD
MDRRGTVGLGLCFLIAAGCQHQVTTLSPAGGASMPAQPPPPPNSVAIKKASSQPPKELPAAVLVSWGDFKAGEALAPDISPARQQEIRDAARQDYEKALKADPKNVPAYQGLARLYTAMHNYDRAIETYQLALKIAPNSAPLWYELGMSHNYQKNWAPALDCLGRAAQLDPANRHYSNALGIVLAEAGRYNESLNCFVRANGQAMGNMRMAQTLQRLQQPALSRQYMEVALQKDPNLASMQRNDGAAAQPPTLQRTAYQEASIPPAQTAAVEPPAPPMPPPMPEPAPSATPAPQVIHLDTVQSENQSSAPQPILVPTPPSLSPQETAPEPNP